MVPPTAGPEMSPTVERDRMALAAIGLLLALAVVGIVIAVWLILDLRKATTSLTEREVEYAAAIGDIALISKTLANDERGFLISGDAQFMQQFDGRVAQAEEAFERAFTNANREQWLAVDRAKRGFESWLEAVRRDVAAYREGDRDLAVERSLTSTRQIRKEFEARLTGMQSLAHFAIETASQTVSGTVERSVVILLGYLVVVLLVGIAVAGWVIQKVLRPAAELQRTVTADRVVPAAERARLTPGRGDS